MPEGNDVRGVERVAMPKVVPLIPAWTCRCCHDPIFVDAATFAEYHRRKVSRKFCSNMCKVNYHTMRYNRKTGLFRRLEWVK